MRKILYVSLFGSLLACSASARPSDMEWFSCTGSGTRIVNGVETEMAPEIQRDPPGIYAVSLAAKTLWWYDDAAHALHAFVETAVRGDAVEGHQRLDHPPYWTMTGEVTIDRKSLAFTSHGLALYPNGDRQVTRGRGTCTRISPRPLD